MAGVRVTGISYSPRPRAGVLFSEFFHHADIDEPLEGFNGPACLFARASRTKPQRLPTHEAGCQREICSACRTGPAAGKYVLKVVPLPGWLETSTNPPWLLTMAWTVESPNPVPWPVSLVEKNGSKI